MDNKLIEEMRDAVHFGATSHLPLFDALVADAQRFAGLRLILTEQDKGKQLAMLNAMEKFMGQQPEMDEANAPTVTPERVNEIADQLILAAAGARHADS